MIRLPKFIILSFVITCFCLLYVWQQTEVFRLAYDGQKNLSAFQDLLDENSILRYNLKKNTSLVRIGNKFCVSGDFQMPDNYCLVKMGSPKENLKVASSHSPKKKNLLSRIFEIKRQAEAKTLNSSTQFGMDGQ
jgi:hypothetical protein